MVGKVYVVVEEVGGGNLVRRRRIDEVEVAWKEDHMIMVEKEKAQRKDRRFG